MTEKVKIFEFLVTLQQRIICKIYTILAIFLAVSNSAGEKSYESLSITFNPKKTEKQRGQFDPSSVVFLKIYF